ncbi:efflux RND transporter periplasmic adaptor subunit [Myroides pelagicus]|uniref:Efflux RND transporter periplasmic adaptor subunit n=1 Tax=Myroides pelagicus TaxID=270914 RepID=A0A7K1GIA7_9FLAO|nr:efflux RND transporter periplasmic adaptor subunit [Myroides pelagicus]MEC4112786.1 efflux RND transporter periplasmic adaptor subunit [Myroides pelagicus]MTH28596.1 efflux RND transporter periplasmic adaptor subunit [Myroides pelagicus]
MKKIITALVVLFLIGGAVYILNNNKAKNAEETAIVAQKSATVSVRTQKATLQKTDTQYKVNGNFLPEHEVIVSAETPGRITQIFVKEGQKVTQGQILARVNIDQINVQLQNATSAYATAKADAARFESAYDTGGVTKQQLDQVQMMLKNAEANLNSAKITASNANVKAPINGIINKKHIEIGTFVGPGVPMFDIVNVQRLKLRVNVDESHVATLTEGDIIKIKASVLPNIDFQGKVTFIAPKADATLNYPVDLLVENNNEKAKLRAGMYGSAYFDASADQDTPLLLIPRNAFVGSVSSNTVFIAKNGKAIETKVVAGRNFGDLVEVLDGLKAGETIITSGQINLSDNSPITIID